MVLGTASGGLWWATDWKTVKPTWHAVSIDKITNPTGTAYLPSTVPAGILNIGAIAADPRPGSKIMYAGTGEANFTNLPGAGILKSIDGGETWQLISTQFKEETVGRIIVDPRHPNILYATVVPPVADAGALSEADGVFRSTDGGKTWKRLELTAAKPDVFVTDLNYILNGNRLVLIAGVGNPVNIGLDPRTDAWRLSGLYFGSEVTDPGGMTTSWQWNRLGAAPQGAADDFGRIAIAVTGTGANAEAIVAIARSVTNVGNKSQGGDIKQVDRLDFALGGGGTKFVADTIIIKRNPGGGKNELDPLVDNALGHQLWANLVVAIDASVAPTPMVYLGGLQIIRSAQVRRNAPVNTKKAWTLASYTKGAVVPHVDHRTFLLTKIDNRSVLFDGDDGGLFRYNAGQRVPTWVDLNTASLASHQINSVGSNQRNNYILLEGSQDNGVARKDFNSGPINAPTSLSWNYVGGGDGGAVAFSPHGNTAFYIVGGVHPTQIYRAVATDKMGTKLGLTEKSWKDIVPKGSAFFNALSKWFTPAIAKDLGGPFYPAMAVSQDQEDVLFFGTQQIWMGTPKNQNWANTGVGYNWTPLSDGRTTDLGSPVTAIGIAVNTPTLTILYAGLQNGQLWKYVNNNGTKSWTPLTVPWPTGRNGVRITSITVDQDPPDLTPPPQPQQPRSSRLFANKNVVYVTLASAGNSVYRTKTGGTGGATAWTDISGNLKGPVYTLAIDPRNPPGQPINPQMQTRTIYIGNNTGVWYAPQAGAVGGTTWTQINDGPNARLALPPVPVHSLQVYQSSQLLAGTYGRGVFVAALPPLKAPVRLAATEGSPANGLVLATFADTNGSTSYTDTINWGDGSAPDNSGVVSHVGNSEELIDSHTFAESGTYFLNATVTPSQGSPETYTAEVDVLDASITGTPGNFSATSFVTTNPVVASFTEVYPGAAVGEFSASIDWGDGSVPSAGVISESGGVFTVSGTHVYQNAGTDSVTIQVVAQGGSSATITSTATVSGPVSAQALPVSATEGASTGTITVASFTATGSGPFGALINWGDGNISTGTVNSQGGNSYTVSGSNSYGTAGSFPLSVTITDNQNDPPAGNVLAVVSGTASVSDAPLSAIGSSIQATQGTALNNVVVARFTDPNLNDSPAEFSATIDWGDGDPNSEEDSADTGTIVAEGNGVYAVLGSHTYQDAGSFTPTVSIADNEGSSVTVNPTVTVAAVAPVVTGLSTFAGPPTGGTPVTISGTALAGASAVNFGTTPATAFNVNSDGTITAIAPALTAGTTVDITVTTPQGTSATSAADQYTAEADSPIISGLSSSSGPSGGATVTLTGTNFAGATAVSFGGTPATDFSVTSNTSITATVPDALAGTVDVTVTTPYGTSATGSADQYQYNATAPAVTGLDSSSGPADGGSLLQITGSNFNGATQVLFGTTAVTDFTILDASNILVTTPALSAGTVDVQVVTPYGTSSTSSADQYTAVAAPALTSLSSSSGPTGGGGSVTLTGSGFTNASQVLFGTTPADSFTVTSDTSITATVPYASAGAVTVTVSTPGGASAAGSGTTYTYNATAPAVSAVGPNAGPTAGGTTVTITGTNLNGATAVSFGATPAADFTIVSATQVTATAPAGTAGVSDITVTTPYGTSSTSASDQFTFADAPAPTVDTVSVSGQTVASGPMAGGTSVTLTGSGFTNTTAVNFGSVAASSYTVVSDTEITATAPAQAAATVDVSVTTPYGSSASSPTDQFTYLAAVPSLSSLDTGSGSTAGGDTVTLTGANFSGATDVRFGGVSAVSFTVNGDDTISAVTPAHNSGVVDITVVGPVGTSTVVPADQFTFNAVAGLPTVTNLGTTTGPSGGGTSVTLTGTGFLTATAVTFGSANVTSFTINSDTSLTALTPPGTGSVAVSVTNAGGVSAAFGSFTYQATAPSVSGLDVATGPATGGTTITITGANLNGASAVNFGAVAATSFTVNSPTSITAVAPAQAAGTVQVTVTTPNGTSAPSGASQFQYVGASAPTVTALTPSFGPQAGGTSVTIQGSGFTGASQVLFGSVAATGVTVLDDTHITATAPAQASGTVDVTVTTPAGTSAVSDSDSFQYVAVGPAVTSLGTTSGPTAGGTAVTINGSNLLGATGVFFGATPATFFQVLSDSQVKAVSPLAAAGAVQVTVVTPNGTSPTNAGTTFTYNADPSATPTVTGLSPNSGPSSGDTTLTLSGTNLAGTTQVLFGSTPAKFSLVSPTALSVTAPPGAVGTVDVTVQTPLGLSATGTADQYTYQAAPPTITALSPGSDTTAGGSVITLTGTNFNTATSVTFGGVLASQLTVTSNTSLTVVDPVGAAGTVNVQVSNADGTSAGTPFTYTATASTPTLTSLSANSGPTGGGNQVTLTGTNFSNVTGVFFGATPANAYTVDSDTSITATVPAATAGAVTVSVATDAGISAAGGGTTYTYNATAPSVTAVSPTGGPTAGGTSVTITGANLNGATAVSFGGTAATSFSVVSATQITATTPAGSTGVSDITVTTPYGTSATSSADQFTYVDAPTVAGLDTSSGSTDGGTAVTITGTNFAGLVSVSFGGVSATAVTVNSPTSITATAPAEGPGTVDVQVTTPQGTSAVVSTDEFTFNAPVPGVTGVSPAAGGLAGGGSVTITGSGFTSASGVSFGGAAATSYTVNNDASITATVPAAAGPGTVDVQVSGPYGDLSATGTADQFTYYDVPSITALTPDGDTASGGGSVTITGVNLAGATAVSFGNVAATSFVVNSDNSLTAVAPAQAAGTVNVTVTTPGGTSAPVSFTYTAASTASWSGPSTGDWATAANWSSGVLPGVNDDVTIPSGVTVTHSGGTDSVHSLTAQGSLVLSGGSLSLAASSFVTALTQTGGTLTGAGNLTVSAFSWTGGIQAGTGSTTISGGNLDSSASVLVVQGRAMSVTGPVQWNGGNALQLDSGAVWSVASSGGFMVQGNGTVTAATGTGTFQNAGTFSSFGSVTFISPVAFNNTGTVTIQSGTLTLSAGTNSGTINVSGGVTLNFAGSYTLAAGSDITGSGAVVFSAGTTTIAGYIGVSTITIQAGARITGAATLSGALTNAGTIDVGGGPGTAGTLTINGSFTQTATGALNVEIGGTTAGSQYDQLVINGMANLGGTLNVTLLNGFVPIPGNTFRVLTFGFSSGSFATITGLTQPGFQFGTQYDSTDVELLVWASPEGRQDAEGGTEGAPDSPRLSPGEAVASAGAEEETGPPARWLEGPAVRNALGLTPEDLFFVRLAAEAAPCDEDMALALAVPPSPADDPWPDLLNLLAGLLNALFGLL